MRTLSFLSADQIAELHQRLSRRWRSSHDPHAMRRCYRMMCRVLFLVRPVPEVQP
ncbi:hypothetical protein [Bradyrhizobium sp. DASA03007]|uniref:hypothetical protein n=1 Tax=unclassified Bradyrhizobium TaxID=2631580 RepID=UPI003F6ECA26